MAKLIVRTGQLAGQEIDLTEPRLIIGASDDCQIVLPDPSIDSAHASLDERNGRWVLQDLGSPGGTLVGGVPVDGPYRLSDGDQITLGDVELEIRGIAPPPGAGDEDTDKLPDAPVIVPAGDDSSLEEEGQPRERSGVGLPLLAIAGGGLLAVIAAAVVTLSLAGRIWMFQEPAAGEAVVAVESEPAAEAAPAGEDPAAAEGAPVLILLEPTSPEITANPGQDVFIHSLARDETGVARIELWLDGQLIATHLPDAAPATDLMSEQHWAGSEPGTYLLEVVAYNQAGLASNRGSFLVNVVATGPGPEAEAASPVSSPSPATPEPSPTAEEEALVSPFATIPAGTETPVEPPRISFFHCTPACTVAEGEGVLLEWAVEEATQVLLDGREVNLMGELLITPTKTITYELTVLNGSQAISRTLQIGVK